MTAAAGIAPEFSAIVDDCRESKLELRRYLDQYVLSNEDKKAKMNFISTEPQYRKRFHVPDDAIPQLMALLHACLQKGVPNHLYEQPDVNDIGSSALTFDFKFESDQSTVPFDTVVPGFLFILMREMVGKWLAFSDNSENHYCFFLVTAAPEYDTKTLKFKSRFRLLFPTLIISPAMRYFIYQRVWQSVEMKALFDQKLGCRIRDCFSRFTRLAPVPLLGSFELDDSAPLRLDAVLTVVFNAGGTTGEAVPVASIEETFSNPVHEMSVNYPLAGGLVEKCHYLPLSNCPQFEDIKRTDKLSSRFQLEYDAAFAESINRSVVDPEIQPISEMMAMLRPSRFSEQASWLEVLRSLASAPGRRFECVAVMSAKDRACVEWEEFARDWEDASSSTDRVRYSHRAIRYWASLDSPSCMRRFEDVTTLKSLVCDVRDSLVQGRIFHSHIAAYLYFRFQNVYATAMVTKNLAHWYEFVTPLSHDVEPGELYKWRCIGTQPDALSEFISRDFKEIATRVHSELNALQLSVEKQAMLDDPKAKQIRNIYRSFDKSIVSIFNNGFKRSVVDESTGLFKRNHFIKQLDRTPHILGVGNGVLEFDGPRAKLLGHYHTYPISLYTDTNYVPYDDRSEYVQTIYRVLRSMVPDDEADALDFLLYYFSTSLDWFTKESLFLIVHGGGCHALDTPIRMFDGAVKAVQDVVAGDVLMGDDDSPRTVQQLFRGSGEMYRITPRRGPDFEVNKGHVLSLRFASTTSIKKRLWARPCSAARRVCVTWYERNGVESPVQKTTLVASEAAALEALALLSTSNERMIRAGDVIDIKVRDLLRWDPRWVRKGLVTLRKSGVLAYSEKVLTMDPYLTGYLLGASVNERDRPRVSGECKRGSVQQRLALLAGAIDSGAERNLPETDQYVVEVANEALLDDVIEVARSLGYACYKSRRECGIGSVFRLSAVVRGGDLSLIPVRHADFVRSAPRERTDLSFSIRPVGRGNYFGFELDGNHRYLDGEFFVHHNSNGKSVLMELFRRTLGELYVRKMPLSFITDQSRARANAADPSVMELKDARLVYYSESDRNEKVNVAKVKEITGGEALSGRQLYKEQENFRANCNHIVTTNHRFVIETTEHAVWRRFMSYRFKICFKHECDPNNPLERPRDPKLIEKVMSDKRYQEAFLSILVHYRSKLYALYDGQILKVPHPTIAQETEEYRQSEDIFQRYIMQRVYYYKGRKQSMDELVNNFRFYYRVENGTPYNAKTADMVHTFRNTILAEYINSSGGLYELTDLYSCSEHESLVPGSILFSEFLKQTKK